MEEKIIEMQSLVVSILGLVVAKPECMTVRICKIENGYYSIWVETSFGYDVGRLVGREGRRKYTIQDFLSMALKNKGYIENYNDIHLRIEGIRK